MIFFWLHSMFNTTPDAKRSKVTVQQMVDDSTQSTLYNYNSSYVVSGVSLKRGLGLGLRGCCTVDFGPWTCPSKSTE